MILTLEEIKNYTRIDSEEEDELLKVLIHAAEEFLENATGKKYPMLEEKGEEKGEEKQSELAKIFVAQLVAYWYEQRNPLALKVGEDFSKTTESILIQLRLT